MEKPFSAAALGVSLMALIAVAKLAADFEKATWQQPYYIYVTPPTPQYESSTEQDLLEMEEKTRQFQEQLEEDIQRALEELERRGALPVPMPRQQPETEVII